MQAAAQWYVVYTKPRWEKKVAELLGRREFEHYCPLNRVVKQWHDRRKLVAEPLFKSYVFVKVTPSQWSYVTAVPGILNFVYWLGQPAIVRTDEIEAIRAFLDAHHNVQLERTDVAPEDTVRILQGALSGHEGKVLEVHPRTVRLLLPSLGYSMVAEVDRSRVEVIPMRTGRLKESQT